MKKILSLLLCLCMLVGAMGMTAFAENAEYEFLDARQAINAYLPGSAPAELVVPAQINGIQALSIMDHCFTENDALESVVLPEGLLFIESSNFNGAPLLRSVTFPETLQVINESVVNGSEVLTEITIPHAVVYIGYNSISLNSALQSVRFTGMAPLFVDEGAFRKNHPDLVFYVPDDQIEAYTAVLPEGANIQPSGADAIPCDYTAPETDFVFDAAAGTITGHTGKAACLEIPASIGGAAVTAIGPSAFEGNLYVHCIILPEGLTTIGDKAFDVMTYLKYVGMPDTVTGIGSRAFAGYRGVCAPELSSRLTGMGEKAFFGAVISDHIELPATLTELPVSAFESSRFTGITLPEGLTTIGEKALYQCKYYTELTIPASVTSIGAYAFAESDRLETVNVLCDAALLTADMFEYCNSLKTINLPGNADAVAADALAAATGADVNIEGAEEEPVEVPVETPTVDLTPYVGRWIAVSAEAEGMTLDQSMLADYGMSMEFTLNEDGTAAMTMEGEEMTGLVWTANETSVTLTAEGEDLVIPFNENGGLTWDLGGGMLMHFAKEGTEAASVPAATPVDTPVETSAVDTSAFVGTWTGDAGVLVLNADGTGVYTANDSEPDNKTWIANDTGIEFTDLWWNNTSAVIDADGNLNIGSGWFIMQPGSAEAPAAAEVDTSVFMGVWYDEAGGVLTFFENGELTFEDVYGVNTMGWEVRDGKMMITTGSWWDSVLTIDENGVLNANDSYYIDYNFTREQPVIEAPTEPEGTEAGEATVVAAEQDDFVGLWFGSEMSVEGETLALADIGMIIEINMAADGTITMYDGEVTETGAWTFVDGAADIDGMILRLMSDGTLVGEDPEGTRIVFTGFVGEWKACYMATGGLTGDLRGMGITSTLILNADGTGSIDFPSEETGTWYEEDGYVRFGESGMPMQLLSGGYLKFGSDLAGYVVYSKDENAVWEPAAEEPVVPADPVVPVVPAETPAPAQPDASDNGGAVDMQALMNRKFIAKTYTAFGQTMDGSMLGEYSLLFREDGTCDFGIAGMVVPNLPWGLQKIATGLTEVDAFVINYYGTMFNAVLTENGFDMDYYGTMTLHFVPAE